MKNVASVRAVQGMSIAGWMVTVVVVVVFITAATKLVPPFMEYNTIQGLIENVLSDPKVGLQSTDELQADLGKRFLINNIAVIEPSDVVITREGSEVVMVVDYEVRKNFFSNIDFAITFKEEFRKSVR